VASGLSLSSRLGERQNASRGLSFWASVRNRSRTWKDSFDDRAAAVHVEGPKAQLPLEEGPQRIAFDVVELGDALLIGETVLLVGDDLAAEPWGGLVQCEAADPLPGEQVAQEETARPAADDGDPATGPDRRRAW
jgi:hypothetical protein